MHPNPFVECPYNKAHQVPKLRLQYHLVKCRRQYPDANIKVCPFNATHIMPVPEFELHLKACSDRNLIEGQKYNVHSAEHGELGNPSFHPNVPTESWSSDESSESDQETEQENGKYSRPEISDQTRPGGALGVSLSAVDVNRSATAWRGFGRGQINHILNEMKKSGQL